jgi:hypothetical protein
MSEQLDPGIDEGPKQDSKSNDLRLSRAYPVWLSKQLVAEGPTGCADHEFVNLILPP